MKLTALAAVAVLALAGCATSQAPASDTTTASAVLTGQQIANQAGCTAWTPDTGQLELYVKESGTCNVDGQPLNVDTFNDATGRDGYLKVAKTFGGTYGQGPLWVIHGDDAAAVAKAVTAAGGTTS